MRELLTLVVEARTAQEAQEAARVWARSAKQRLGAVRLTRVRPTGGVDEWAVELAYVVVPDQQEAAL